jgi:hypothetical protein
MTAEPNDKPKEKPKPSFERLEPWLQDVFKEHPAFRGLPGVLVQRAMEIAQQGEMSERASRSAKAKHAKTDAIKAEAAEEYQKIRATYPLKKEAARYLFRKFGVVAFSTYQKWVSEWS